MKTHVKNTTSEHAQSRPRDKSGRFPKTQRPTFDEILAGFGDSWSKWRTLAQAIQSRDETTSTLVDDRSSSLDSEGVAPSGALTGNPMHWTTSEKLLKKPFDYDFYKRCTKRETLPTNIKEVWAQCGRSSGKTRASSGAIVALAIKEYPTLAPGERGKAFLIAQNRSTARQAFGYVRGILKSDKTLNRMILSETKNTISLSNFVDIEIVSANYKSVRGFSLVGCILDEIAFYWQSVDAANSDKEILNAIRPGLARVPGSVLFVISSPYAQRGELWEANKRYYGNEHENILFWLSKTENMNPTFDRGEIERAFAEDAASASVEYDSEFRKESATFITSELYDACVQTDVKVLPPIKGQKYLAFLDAAGGSGSDSTALCIGHSEQDDDGWTYVLDALIERRPPFSPASALQELAQVLKQYRISTIYGDRFASGFTSEALAKSGIKLLPTEFSKSKLYTNALPLLTSGRCLLLDHPRLRNQMINLTRSSKSR